MFQLVNGIEGSGCICETEVMEEVALTAGGGTDYTSPGCHTSKNANGNIITLTLKNNHLIVETEERAVSLYFTYTRFQLPSSLEKKLQRQQLLSILPGC